MFFGNNNLIRKNTSNPDPHWNNVVLYLKGDGTNDSTNIIDSSPTPKTITRFGGTKISTAQSKYGGSSILFDGSGDYLSSPNSTDWDLGTGNFTIECWIRTSAPSAAQLFINRRANASLTHWLAIGTLGGNFTVFGSTSGSAWDLMSNTPFGAVSANAWQHIAVVRNGTNFSGYRDGTGTTVATSSATVHSSGQALNVGGDTNGFFLNGYIDSFRITKGVARYTANFNPETDTYLAY